MQKKTLGATLVDHKILPEAKHYLVNKNNALIMKLLYNHITNRSLTRSCPTSDPWDNMYGSMAHKKIKNKIEETKEASMPLNHKPILTNNKRLLMHVFIR